MNRAARILGVSASLWACDLWFANQALAAPPTVEAVPGAKPEPPRGRGLYGAGIFGVTFGIFNIGYGIPISITGPGDAYFTGYIPIAFGAAFIVLGAIGIHYGKWRRKAWRAWEADTTAPLLVYEPPSSPSHVPWLIVGGITTPLGIATIGAMVPTMTDPILNTPNFAYVVTTWGAASVVAGVAMLTVGGVQAHRHRRSDRNLAWVPTGWARHDSFGFGVAGRF